jgi:hypothetical protein
MNTMDENTIARRSILKSIDKINDSFIQEVTSISDKTLHGIYQLSQCTVLLANAHKELGEYNESKD